MKKIIAFALVLTMMLSMSVFSASAAAWDGTTASESLKGEGTADSPYLVESAEDLKYIQVQVDAGTTFEGKYFKQTADIDLNNKEWAPIGERTAKPFIGLYDGNGFKIVNFYQTFSYRFGGLFAYMTTAADFTPGLINITLEGKMDGGSRVGDIYSGALLGWTQQSNNNPNKILVKGIDKQLVGAVAANVRSVREPEPYHGKGIKYIDEHVRRKEGKTGKK